MALLKLAELQPGDPETRIHLAGVVFPVVYAHLITPVQAGVVNRHF